MEVITILECEDYIAKDRAVAKEFLGLNNSGLKNLSIAYTTIPAGVTVQKRCNLKSEETYHIVEGTGVMYLDDQQQSMVTGQAVAIIPGQWHSIASESKTDLVMIVNCAPAWTLEDQVFE